MENVFDWFQTWYRSQCDGDWEHEFGVKIETVDNPGWYLTINLTETELENIVFTPVQVERDELNWYFCLIRNRNFEASCGPCNLTEVFQVFKDWVTSNQTQNE